MQDNLSTFPRFKEILQACGDNDEAVAQYLIKVSLWHANMVSQIEFLLENAETQLSDTTAKMVLQEILGNRKKLYVTTTNKLTEKVTE